MKRKSSKTRILTVLAALLLLLCSACSGAQGNAANNVPGNAANDAGNSVPGNTVDPGQTVPAVEKVSDYAARNNNLEFINEYSSDTSNPLTVCGLKDEAVQQKINDAIKAESDRIGDPSFLPSGRGVRMYEKQAVGEPMVYFYSIVYANCDNILSVVMQYNRRYDMGNNRAVILQYFSPLNFDLATGDLLKLQDLFPDGTDCMQYLNGRMIELIQRSDPSREPDSQNWDYFYSVRDPVPPLISEFKGLREDQPFYLSDKGQLVIVLDPQNPEFYMENGSAIVNIDISDIYYAGVRYGGNRGLYLDNTDRYHLVQMEIPGGSILESKELKDVLGFQSAIFSGSIGIYRYPGLTEKQNDFLTLKEMDLDQMMKDEYAEIEEFRKTHNNYGNKYLNINSYANRIGGLVNLSVTYNSIIYAANRDYNNVDKRWMRCCRLGSDEELSLQDIFTEGADWKGLIKQAIIRQALDDSKEEGTDPQGRQFGDYLDELLDHVSGFVVEMEGLGLSYSENRAPEIFGDYQYNSGWYDYIVRYIRFENIGYENIALFGQDFWKNSADSDSVSRFGYTARDNGITCDATYDGAPLVVSGLKDMVVQQKINDAINAEYDRLKDPSYIPAGRSVKVYEKQAIAAPRVSMYGMAWANCDNVLSVIINYTRAYRLGENRTEIVQQTVPLNFDLSTGEQLKLADLFPDGFDVKQYLDSRLMQMVQGSDPSKEFSLNDSVDLYTPQEIPALVAEFRGIRDDQPFYLTDKGILALILDSGNPEFYIPEGSAAVTIEIPDVWAADKRFGGDRGLYEDNTDRYHLVSLSIPGAGIMTVKACSEYADADPEKFSGSVMLYNYPALTDAQNSFLSMEFLDIEKTLGEEAAELNRQLQTSSKANEYIEMSSSASRSGAFLNLSASYYKYDNWSGNDSSSGMYWYKCYIYGSDETPDISEIFREDVDWKEVLKDAMIKRAGSMDLGKYNNESLYSQNFSDYLYDMIGRINGFNVLGSGIRLSFDGSSAREFFDDYKQRGGLYENCVRYLEYNDLGYENLSIFE